MKPQDRARELRPIIEKAAVSLNDEDALNAVELYPEWGVGITYTIDQRISYKNKLYRVVQSHISQVGWTPDITPALWVEVAQPGEIPVWKQPTGVQDAYALNDKVWYPAKNDNIYISIVDVNVWEPTVYGWDLIN